MSGSIGRILNVEIVNLLLTFFVLSFLFYGGFYEWGNCRSKIHRNPYPWFPVGHPSGYFGLWASFRQLVGEFVGSPGRVFLFPDVDKDADTRRKKGIFCKQKMWVRSNFQVLEAAAY